jgi:lipopolysaccharide transport system ATP-binding protein
MNDTALTLENVSKYYRLGEFVHPGAQYSNVTKLLSRMFRSPRPVETPQFQEGRDDLWALKDINLEVMHGEAIGIVGRNGAGKSTLVKIISQITAPTRGKVKLYGRVSALLGVGAGFHPDMTGRENVYMNGIVMGMSRRQIDRKFDDIVAFSEIERFIETPVKRYSKGMKTRLAVSVALNLDPDILVVDEVLAVGDIRFRDQCMDKIAEVIKGGTTLLFISHSIARISRLCNKGILLRDGRLVSVGPPEEVIKEYLDVDVKDGSVNDDEIGAVEVRTALQNIESAEGGDTTGPKEEDVCGEIEEVEIINADTEAPVTEVAITEGTKIRIRFKLLKGQVEISAGTDFYVGDQLAFGSRQPPWPAEHPGRYDLDLLIPGNLLSEVKYKVNVSVSIYEHGTRHVVKKHTAVKFKPHDIRDKTNIPVAIRNMNPGVVSPALQWSVSNTHIGGNDESISLHGERI